MGVDVKKIEKVMQYWFFKTGTYSMIGYRNPINSLLFLLSNFIVDICCCQTTNSYLNAKAR